MTAAKRRELALERLKMNGEITMVEMSELFPGVSSMTLRRDFAALEEMGAAVRTRGGAVYVGREGSSGEAAYAQRIVENASAKQAIARAALLLIEPGRSIFFDSGTTIMQMARILPDLPLSVVTSGPNIALEVARRMQTSVTMLGGQLSRSNLTASGGLAMQWIKRLNIDIAFLACSGYASGAGFTSGVLAESDIKREIVQVARQKVMLMDATKIDRALPYTFAQLPEIDTLVIDKPDPALEDEAQAAGVRVIIGEGGLQ